MICGSFMMVGMTDAMNNKDAIKIGNEKLKYKNQNIVLV